MQTYLVETALLGHGLPSLSDSDLTSIPRLAAAPLVWLEQGKIKTGSLQDFLPLRSRADEIARVNRHTLGNARLAGLTAVLTASATMAVCAELGITLAVTAGMGGIGPRPSSNTGDDLYALAELPAVLLATSPKDVFDLRATILWLKASGVAVFSRDQRICDGFLCRCGAISLDALDTKEIAPPMLLLNAIPPLERCISPEQLALAMAEGEAQAKWGHEYHPAVNAALDRLSGGRSSRLQLASLCANIALADAI